MKPRDLFGVILRAACLYVIVWGMWNTVAGVRYSFSMILSLATSEAPRYNPFNYFAYGLPAIIVGVIGLRFAEGLIDFTYRRDSLPPLLPIPPSKLIPPILPIDPLPASVPSTAAGESHQS
jgi:hypothetical protein